MRGPAGGLRLLCQLGVALWIGLGLSWMEPLVEEDPASEPVAEVAPLRPRQEPAATPAREALQPTPVGAREIDEGLVLLDSRGRFPVLTCGYEDFGSFARYARAMTELGARFVVVERRSLRAEVDLESGAMHPTPPGPGFSPRARDYSGEPALSRLAQRARERFGPEAEVMMLVPRELDAGLFGGIARSLTDQGESAEGYRELRGSYVRGGDGGVRLRVEEGIRHDGSRNGLALVFDLRQIAAVAKPKSAPGA